MYDVRNLFAWVLLFWVAVIIMIIGIQGSLGKVVAVVFTPGLLDVNSSLAQSQNNIQPTGDAMFPGMPQNVVTMP